MTARFTLLDVLVLVAYLVGTTALGLWLGRRQRDAKDYFVADRAIPWWAVMFSIVASETSALTFISMPGLAYGTKAGVGDLGFLQVAAGYIIGRFVVAHALLPRYYQGELVTAYALLEQRFGLATRRFTSIVFMVTRALADSVRVFATAIPVALIIGPSVKNEQLVMPLAILILGALTVLYTYRGGMKAVVWTELLQAAVYIGGGISAVILLGRSVPGGWSAIIDSARASVPVPTPTACAAPDARANSASNASSSGPRMNQPRAITRSMAALMSAASSAGVSERNGMVIGRRRTRRSGRDRRRACARAPREGRSPPTSRSPA